MSDAVVASKQDLVQAAFDTGFASTPLLELINDAIPTFGGTKEAYSEKVFSDQKIQEIENGHRAHRI